MSTRVLIPNGVLGIGFDAAALKRGVDQAPDIIVVDGGSTDSGPHYLGTGTSKYSRNSSKAEWRALMEARAAAGVPLVIGSAGTCGTDTTVDWMMDITREAASELGQNLRIARLYSSQKPDAVADAFPDRIDALAPEQPIDADLIRSCTNIVALAGVEQMHAALDTGADIVIAGRATDTAGIAALPIARQDHTGAAWHGAKIGECGAYCSTQPNSGVIVIEFDATGFTVEPMAEDARVTPESVSAHMLYENSDPYRLYEPGGHLDVSNAIYTQIDPRRVRVEGSRWIPADAYTVKLEGARRAGFQTVIMAMLRDPRYVREAQAWAEKILAFLHGLIRDRIGLDRADYALDMRLIGKSGALGRLEARPSDPAEVGALLIVTADSQERAHEIAKLSNPFMLHFPLTENEPHPSHAFPYSPAETDRGAVHAFCLNHVMTLDDPMDAFRLEVEEIG